MTQDIGRVTGSRADASSLQAVSTEGFDPARIIALTGDKYSPNLRAFLARQTKYRGPLLRVFNDAEGQRWIGFIDEETWFIGTRLWRVLCVGRKAEVGAWPKLASELVEEAGFWDRYEAVGRCAIDEAHKHWFVNGDDRFAYPSEDDRMAGDDDTRTCRWCGHEQKRVRWTETVERERWEPNTSGGDA